LYPGDLAIVKMMLHPSSMSRPSGVPKQPYHHGNLREALIRAAAELVSERGLEGASLREVARRAGVSHGAPYHHFKSKERLLAALADEGFDDLDRALARAQARADSDPRAQLEALGVAYVRFAVEQPEMFRAMFRASAKEPSAEGPFGRLLGAVTACLAGSSPTAADSLRAALFGWCTIHGLTALWLDGPIRREHGPQRDVEELSAYVSRVFASWVTAGAPE
jgi:AcrR family transcriptional regulator